MWVSEEKFIPKARYSLESGFGHFRLIPFLQVRGTRPAHSAPASVTLLSCLLCSPQPFPWTLFALSHFSILLHLILWISWTSACSTMCWQFKDSKRGHQDASFKSDKQSKIYPPPSLSFHLSFGESSWDKWDYRTALKQGVEPPP